MLASTDWHGTLVLWDLTSGRPKRTIESRAELDSVAFSPDGALVAATATEAPGYSYISVWEVSTGRLAADTIGGGTYITDTAFSPDGTVLAAAHDDGTLRLFSVTTGDELRTMKVDTSIGFISSLSFSPDGSELVAGGNDSIIRVWDVATGSETRALTGHKGQINSVVHSPDGGLLATSSADGTVAVWNANTGAKLRTMNIRGARTAQFSQNGAELAVSRNGTVELWSIATAERLRAYAGHGQEDSTGAAVFSPDGTRLAAGSELGSIVVWNVDSDPVARVLGAQANRINAAKFSPDGHQLATASDDATIKLWDIASDQLRVLEGHSYWVESLSYSPDGALLAASDADQQIIVWDVKSGERRLELSAGPVSSVTFSPDGTQLVAVPKWGSEISLWEVSTGSWIRTFRSRDPTVIAAAFNIDGSELSAVGVHKTLNVWDVDSGDEIRTLNSSHGAVHSATFSPDGTLLATIDNNDRLTISDIEIGERVRVLPGLVAYEAKVVFSPDGTQIFVSKGQTIKRWDVSTNDTAKEFTGHAARVVSLAVTPDAAHLAAGASDQTLGLWRLDDSEHLGSLFATAAGAWILTTPDGRVTGSEGEDGGASLIYWQVGDVQLPGFVGWQRYHTPGLLAEIMNATSN
jgi:WD40 repeat protein